LKFWIGHNKSRTYSRRILQETLQHEKLLSENPFLGNPTDLKDIRRIIILKNFSMYYIILKDEIEIIAFWDNRRDPGNLEI